jgi:hypothetical protein
MTKNHRRRLAIRKEAHGADHKDVATACSSLARLHKARGRLDEAAPLLARTLAIRENWYPPAMPAWQLLPRG